MANIGGIRGLVTKVVTHLDTRTKRAVLLWSFSFIAVVPTLGWLLIGSPVWRQGSWAPLLLDLLLSATQAFPGQHRQIHNGRYPRRTKRLPRRYANARQHNTPHQQQTALRIQSGMADAELENSRKGLI